MGLGLFLIASGLICNPPVVSRLLTYDGVINSNLQRLAIWFLDVVLVGLGTYIIVKRRSINIATVVFQGMLGLVTLVLCDLYYANWKLNNFQRHEETINIHVTDKQLGWKPKANFSGQHKRKRSNFDVEYETDEWGFKKIDNVENTDINIYFIGDSMTFGNGVPNHETYTNIIADRYLTHNAGVYNAAVMGHGVPQMYQRYLELEDRTKPGDIVVFAPIADDIKRNVKVFDWAYNFVFLQGFADIHGRVEYLPYYENGEIVFQKLEPSFFNRLNYLALKGIVTGPPVRKFRGLFLSDTNEEAKEITEIIRKRCRSRGVKFVLIFLPMEQEILTGIYAVDVSLFDFFDIRKYYPVDKEELHGIYLKDDVHWNLKGHQITAHAIVDVLKEMNILDKAFLKPLRVH
jgi:lysophospholipase L1-like esterase